MTVFSRRQYYTLYTMISNEFCFFCLGTLILFGYKYKFNLTYVSGICNRHDISRCAAASCLVHYFKSWRSEKTD